MVIYKTTNLINGKIYIGKDAKNNKNYLGSGNLIKLALKKYGKENFKKEILEICCTNEELSDKECFWIKKLNSTNTKIGYNLSEGGIGGCLGCKRSEESKQKITGINNHFYGKHHSEKSKEQISKVHKDKIGPNNGKPTNDIVKNKISVSKKGTEPWNKGKIGVYSKETIEKFRIASLCNSNFSGKTHSVETKKIIGEKAKNRYTTETHPSFIKIPKKELVEKLNHDTIKNTAEYFGVSIDCIRKRIKVYNINNRKVNSENHGFFKIISDETFELILMDRVVYKYSLENLGKKYGFSAGKIKREFVRRNI